MRKRLKYLTGILLVFLFVSCEEKSNDKREIKNLVYTMGVEPITLDPYSVTDVYSRRVIKNIFDTLLETDSENKQIPSLAKSWRYLDEKTLELKLNENIKFHNGEILTSEDVKYSLEKAKESLKVGYYFDMIESIETPDLTTIVIKTKEPSGTLLTTLSHAAGSIVNKKDYEVNKDKKFKPVGTGAYKLVEWSVGSKLVLEKNTDYFGVKPTIEKVEIKIIPEDTNRVIALQTGEAQIAFDLSASSLKSLENEKEINTYSVESLGTNYIGFNVTHPKLKDIRVREAISKAIDMDSAIEVLFEGKGKRSTSILGPKVFGYKQNSVPSYNIEEARKLLKEAGYNNDLELTLLTGNVNLSKQFAEIFQYQLKEIGINLKIVTLDMGALIKESSNQQKSELFFLGWSNSTGDADNGFTANLHTVNYGVGNRFFYSNDNFDKLVNLGKIEIDQNKRLQYYKDAQDILAKELPFLPVSVIMYNSGVNKKIEGYSADALGYLKFNTLKIN
ncbi:MAG: ABC transporter substrate-binding protein [Cetobacterium sp.]